VKHLIHQIRCASMEKNEQKKEEMIEEIKKDPALDTMFEEVNNLFGKLFSNRF
jgi:tellurite resistance protein